MNGGGGASILGGGGTTTSGGGGGFLISSITLVSMGAFTTSTTFCARPVTSAYTTATCSTTTNDRPTACRRGSACCWEKFMDRDSCSTVAWAWASQPTVPDVSCTGDPGDREGSRLPVGQLGHRWTSWRGGR